MVRVELSESQQEELQRLSRSKDCAGRARDRLEMIRLSAAGWSAPKIVKHLGWHEESVCRHLKAFQKQGFVIVWDRPRAGRPKRVTKDHLQALGQMLDETKQTWSARKLCQWLFEQYQVSVCPGHLSVLLHRSGFRYKRTKTSVQHKANPAVQDAKAAELAALKKAGKGTDHRSVLPG